MTNNMNKTIVTGWVLAGLAGLLVMGMYGSPHSRDPEVTSLIHSPSFGALMGTVGLIIGSNIFTFLPMILAGHALAKKDRRGVPLLWASLLIFFAITCRLFMHTAH